MPTLPLFPLGAVLAPGERMPLRVFEARYVVLLRDLMRARLQGGSEEFGIILIRKGHEVGTRSLPALHDVGCAARLDSVHERDEHVFEVVATGLRRFRLDGIDEAARTPYLTGYVTWLKDRVREAELAAHLAGRLRDSVGTYRLRAGMGPARLPSDPVAASYAGPAAVMLDQGDRQLVLATRGVEDRLRVGLRLVHRETALVSELRAFPGAFAPQSPVAN